MKHLLVALFLVMSLPAFSYSNYLCSVKKSNRAEVATLNLPDFDQTTGEFIVFGEDCLSRGGRGYSDVCELNGNKLILGKKLSQSLLIGSNSKVYDANCKKRNQEEQQEQEEAPEPEGPGHGGSTGRPRRNTVI